MRERRVEFVIRAIRGECLSGLCREFGITRPTGYLWLRRYRDQGVAGMEERSRRPLASPLRTATAIEQRVVELRRQRPDWGARKLAVLLAAEGIELPVVTLHRVLVRHGLVTDPMRHAAATRRFEREQPNQLWQMDFKGQKGSEAAIGPLSVLDDHSRYLVALEQTGTTRGEAVRERLEDAFRAHGVPEAMLMDHGAPWWNGQGASGWTRLMVWIMKQGIRCHFSGMGHPQTQGKVERFHGSLEQARRRPDGSGWLAQPWLDAFRHEYNQVRPHEALGMRTPASVWTPSPRAFDPQPPAWVYGLGAELRKVNCAGDIYVGNHPWMVSLALCGETVRLERLEQRILVYFCHTLVREIDLCAQRSTRVDRWTQIQPQNQNPKQNCKGSPDNNV